MGGKKNKNKKKNKQNKNDESQSQITDSATNASPAVQDDNTVTPEQSSVAKEGGVDSVSVSIIFKIFDLTYFSCQIVLTYFFK